MKLIIIGIFVALMALGTSCAQISQPVAEVAPQGTSDGIKVHGDWTVTVTNPDGTVDAVHEFENELAPQGDDVLVSLLAADSKIETWNIVIFSLGHVIDCEETSPITPSGGLTSLLTTHSVHLDPDPPNKAFLQLTATCVVKDIPIGETGSMLQLATSVALDEHVKIGENGSTVNCWQGTPCTWFAMHFPFSPNIEVVNSQQVSFTVRYRFE